MEEILFRLIENVTHVTQPSKILRRNVLLPFFPYQCLSQKEYKDKANDKITVL